jgi:DNA repair protein SbcC/Rad50
MGEVAAWERLIDIHRRGADLAERTRRGDEMLAAARSDHERAGAEAAAAHDEWIRTTRRVTQLERIHAAHALRAELADGGPCPVCLQQVAEVPRAEPPDDLAKAHQAAAEAQAKRDRTAAAVGQAAAEVAKLSALVEERTQQLTAARLELDGAPGLDECAAAMERARELQARLEEATARQAEARSSMAAATDRLALAQTAGERAAEALDRARDIVSGLDPPVPTRRDPAADWGTMLAWRDDRSAGLAADLGRVDADISERQTAVERIRRDMVEKAEEAGVVDLGEDVRVAVAGATAAAETGLARLEADLEKKDRLQERRATLDRGRARYAETATLLRSNRFQQWLLEEALVGLVDFANAELAKLAGGAYSLAVTGGEFEVIDHRNAEARRSVKTLSGGETFLVSLALALALAERVVATSAIGTARIESMFLDEGFGTLDAETLDTVAAVVQELGTGERMIGLVTHVRELAEQIPVRYEVRKLPEGSTVTRVDS